MQSWAFLQLVPVFNTPELNKGGVSKKELVQKGISESSLKTLLKNNIFESFEEVISRFPNNQR